MKSWEILESEYVVKDRWIGLRADTCRTSHGHVLDPYYVLEYSDWVHVVAFDADFRVLLVRLYRHGVGEFTTEIPSGRIDEGETPIETAKRELLEETGHASDRIIHLGGLTPNAATHTNRSHPLVAYDCRKIAEPNPAGEEEIETLWVEAEELLKWIDDGRFYHSLQIAGILMAFRHAGLLSFVRPPA